MLNNVILVGRVVEDPQLKVLESGYKVANITLAIQKPFRNEENEYETDYVPVQAWMKTAELICEYIGKGSVLGCKCRLQTRVIEIDEKKYRTIDVIVERISFIYTKPRADKDISAEEVPKDDATIPFNEDFNDEIVIEEYGEDHNDGKWLINKG